MELASYVAAFDLHNLVTNNDGVLMRKGGRKQSRLELGRSEPSVHDKKDQMRRLTSTSPHPLLAVCRSDAQIPQYYFINRNNICDAGQYDI